MRRDNDLIRALVLYIEDHDEVDSARNRDAFPAHDEVTIARHIQLLLDDSLAEGNVLKTATPPGIAAAFADRLTSNGHDFAENIRNDTIWRKTKTAVASKGGSVSLSVLVDLVKEIARKHFLE